MGEDVSCGVLGGAVSPGVGVPSDDEGVVHEDPVAVGELSALYVGERGDECDAEGDVAGFLWYGVAEGALDVQEVIGANILSSAMQSRVPLWNWTPWPDCNRSRPWAAAALRLGCPGWLGEGKGGPCERLL